MLECQRIDAEGCGGGAPSEGSPGDPREVDKTTLPGLKHFNKADWGKAQYSFLPAYDTPGPSSHMQQFWLTHPIELTDGQYMDEDRMLEMDKFILQDCHQQNIVMEWFASLDLTRLDTNEPVSIDSRTNQCEIGRM